MLQVKAGSLILSLSEDLRRIVSLQEGDRELIGGQPKPLFAVGLRGTAGEEVRYDAEQAAKAEITLCSDKCDGTLTEVCYSGFPQDITAKVQIRGGQRLVWHIAVENHSDYAVEYVDFPEVCFGGKLKKNGGDASVLWPYNEGVLVEDGSLKQELLPLEYPSCGNYAMFPNMIFAQFMVYLYDGKGIYMGMHDGARGPKALDFCCKDGGTEFRTRLFMGGSFGQDAATEYDIVWEGFAGDWHDGADIYRQWFDNNLPEGLESIAKRTCLPAWYTDDMPVVVTYPVRGKHDTDRTDPNGLFPYENVMPYVEALAKRLQSRVMVLLMHWEGTAPWAPPYVWPPYGGKEMLLHFMEQLHKQGHLLGVYCSGFGYTEQSNLIEGYNMSQVIRESDVREGFSLAPDQSLVHSRICGAQRLGYDICPASRTGRRIMEEAMEGLLSSGIDYVQALDQNHGGGMYLCYAQDHGHAPTPGAWMTEAANDLYRKWRTRYPNTMLGCESAAAEPFLANLGISDNRFELNYIIGQVVPVYGYLYHSYLHNFMGNQVSCRLQYTTMGLNIRIAHSFLAGDLITLVWNDEGKIMQCWGLRRFHNQPDQDQVLEFVARLEQLHKAYPQVFRDARMVKPLSYDCKETTVLINPFNEYELDPDLPEDWTGEELLNSQEVDRYEERVILSTAWENGQDSAARVQFLVNYTDDMQLCSVELKNVKNVLLRQKDTVQELPAEKAEFWLEPRSAAVLEYEQA